MKKLTQNLQAFTLLELLITATIMVAVSMLTLSIFTSVAHLQANRRSDQSTALNVRAIADQINADLARSNSNTVFGSGYIAMNVPVLDQAGVPSGSRQLVEYCMQPKNTSYIQLMRYTKNMSTDAGLTGFVPGSPCGSQFVTSDPPAVVSDRFVHIRAFVPQYALKIPANTIYSIQYVLSASYEESMEDPGTTPLATSPAVTLRQTVNLSLL